MDLRGEVATRLERFRHLTPHVLRIVHGRANVRYLTGYDGGGFSPWLLIDDETLKVVFYTADEDSIEALETLNMELRPFSPRDQPLMVLGQAIEESKHSERIHADLAWWPYPEVAGLGIELGDCSELLRQLRVVKSPWEQEQLRLAGATTMKVMAALEEHARAGSCASELGAYLYRTAIELGSGPFTWIPYVSVGGATFRNHTTWDADRTAVGAYLFEFATSMNGYGTPLSHSWTPNPEGQRAIGAIESGIEAIGKALRPRADPARLHELMEAAIANSGFHFSHRAGYSIGLGGTETWMEGDLALLGPQSTYEILAGMAFHVVGSVVVPGQFGVARSKSLLVTLDGCEVLAS